MAHVLGVTAIELGDPVACLVLMKTDNGPLHSGAQRARRGQK